MKKKAKFLFKTILVIVSIVIIIFTALVIWLKTGPKSLSFLKPYVEKELNSLSEDYKVQIKDSFINWDNELDKVTISAKNVTLINNEKDVIKTDELLFDFSFIRILGGNILSSEVTIVKPIFKINTDFKKYESKNSVENIPDDGKQEIKKNILTYFYNYLDTNKNKLAFSKLRIKKAKLIINNGEKESVWNIQEGFLNIDQKSAGKKVNSEFTINFGETLTSFKINMANTADKKFDIFVGFKDLPSYTLTDISKDSDKFVKSSNLKIDGNLKFFLTSSGKIPELNYSITNVYGRIKLPDYLPNELLFNGLKSSGSLTDNFSNLNIDALNIEFEKASFDIKGKVGNLLLKDGKNPNIKIDVNINSLPLDNVKNYWPYQFNKKLRNWITTKLSYGYVDNAKILINLSGEDLTNIARFKKKVKNKEDVNSLKNPISDKAINASFDVKFAKLNFHDNYPNIEQINTIVKVNGGSLFAKANKALLKESEINNVSVNISDFWNVPPKVFIEGETKGNLQDYSLLLKGANANKKSSQIVESIYNSKGFSEGKFKLEIPFKKKIKIEDFNLDVYLNSNYAYLPNFYKDTDINKGNFILTIRKNLLDVSGDALFAGIETNFKYVTNLADIKNFGHRFQIKAKSDMSKLKEINISIPFITGEVEYETTFNIINEVTKVSGTINAAKAVIDIAEINFSKEENKKADIDINVEISKDLIDIKSIYARGDDFEFNGAIELKENKLTKLNFSKAVFNKNDLALQYTKSKNDIDLQIKAKQVDYANLDFKKLTSKSNNSKSGKLSFVGFIENMPMKNDQKITNFMAKLECESNVCSELKLKSTIAGNNYINALIAKQENDYRFYLKSDNAGAVIKGIGVSEFINEGTLTIDAKYPLIQKDENFFASGNIKLDKFKAVKTPILGKLLTLASFRGITDLLNNKGISFNKFDAPFEFYKGQLNINNAKTSGSSIGITGNGFISLKEKYVDINGVIVPAYELNRVLGNIPLIGKMIIGNEDEGIIATKYSVQGKYPGDVKAKVNPLSILTPGFLRNIFNF